MHKFKKKKKNLQKSITTSDVLPLSQKFIQVLVVELSMYNRNGLHILALKIVTI